MIEWLGKLPDREYAKLARVGLVTPREPPEPEPEPEPEPVITLGEFLNEYIKGRKDVKENTELCDHQAIDSLGSGQGSRQYQPS